MEAVEGIYSLLNRTKYGLYMKEVLRDLNIINFAIISTDVEYKTNVYNNMLNKYSYDLEMVGYNRALEIIGDNANFKNLSEEAIKRNTLSVLRKWIIRCSGYMCVRRVAEETISEGIDIYMKRYSIADDVVDMTSLNSRIVTIDEEMLTYLQDSI